jgi:hypothetical protein
MSVQWHAINVEGVDATSVQIQITRVTRAFKGDNPSNIVGTITSCPTTRVPVICPTTKEFPFHNDHESSSSFNYRATCDLCSFDSLAKGAQNVCPKANQLALASCNVHPKFRIRKSRRIVQFSIFEALPTTTWMVALTIITATSQFRSLKKKAELRTWCCCLGGPTIWA